MSLKVSCIAKGKEHKPYEFGTKACLVVTEKKGLALSMTTHLVNPCDGHLLEESKRKAESNAKTTIQRILVDRGFRGHEVLVSYIRGLPKGLKTARRRR